jgi:outer membrane lipoprotein-sorting protein
VRRASALAGLLLAPLLASAQDATPGSKAPDALEALRAKVKTAMASVKTTRGKFHQTKRLAIFDDKQEHWGTFAIERPDKLRWETERPFKSILVIAGGKGARWNETRAAVERFSLAEKPGIDVAVKQLFQWYGGGFEEAQGQFTVAVPEERTVVLVPKNEKVRDVLQRITIRLAPTFATIESIALDEKEGDRTEIDFTDVEINKDLDAKTFEVEPK